MEWLNNLFFSHSPLQAVVIISIIIAAGLGLGKIRFFGISLGVTFVFFAGILAGHLGFSIDAKMLSYAESLGLVLFVYELGLQVGPGFFSSFRKGGVQLNMLAMGVVLLGTLMAVALSYATSTPMSEMVGILCGATTNTPALGAAQQTLKELGMQSTGAALSCAVTYPLGVVGVILAMLAVRKLFVKPSDIDNGEHDEQNQTFIATYSVQNPGIFDKCIKEVAEFTHTKFVISRLWRDNKVSIPTSEMVLKENDRLLVV
ncbi:MAG: transporter, partial [Bacteroidaceae bacterium]|nr:transporter [Bacteroidaceae bacterium]